ncbi:MAG TPA: hypothetical protein VFQ61_05850 [Polyangiaceae bacterium]|nr:hypothetical protein [Polyangiaceae bacterium]
MAGSAGMGGSYAAAGGSRASGGVGPSGGSAATNMQGSGSILGAAGAGSTSTAAGTSGVGGQTWSGCPPETKTQTKAGCRDRIEEYPAGRAPSSIAVDSEGMIWFEDMEKQQIVRVDRQGNFISAIQAETAPWPRELLRGDGDVLIWFTDSLDHGLHRFTKQQAHESVFVGEKPRGLAEGPDDDILVVDSGKSIYRVKKSFEGISVLDAAASNSVALGADKNFWFPSHENFAIGKLTAEGNPTYYSVSNGFPDYICAGPDGALWFTDSSEKKIGRIDTKGGRAIFGLPDAGQDAYQITAGSDSAIWFTDRRASKIGRVVLSGGDPVFAYYPTPSPNSSPTGITLDEDGTIWFTENRTGKIGHLYPDPTDL